MDTQVTTGRADAFFRGGSKTKATAEQEVYEFTFPCPADRTRDLAWLMTEATRVRGARGSFTSGVFQIQTDDGIWQREDRMRLDFDTPAKRAKAIFKTWQQLEDEEASA